MRVKSSNDPKVANGATPESPTGPASSAIPASPASPASPESMDAGVNLVDVIFASVNQPAVEEETVTSLQKRVSRPRTE